MTVAGYVCDCGLLCNVTQLCGPKCSLESYTPSLIGGVACDITLSVGGLLHT